MTTLVLEQAPIYVEEETGWYIKVDDDVKSPSGCERKIYIGNYGLSCLGKICDGAKVVPRKET